MKKYIITPAIVPAALLFGMGTANASTESYLAYLREEISYVVQQYGPQALIKAIRSAAGRRRMCRTSRRAALPTESRAPSRCLTMRQSRSR
jgi:hypothetical protein